MAKNILISVAMTCYNQAQYVRDAIESVVKQTYINWELVIVDDCSTDESLKVINQCVQKYNIKDKVRVISSDGNRGYGTSLGRAINESRGVLVAIVDSDDALSCAESLGVCVKAHLDNPKVALTYSNFIVCDDKLRPAKTIKTKQIKNYLKNKGKVSHLKVIKKELYNKTEGINPKLKQTVDKDLILKMEEVGALLHVDKELYYYRKHGENLSLSLHKKTKPYQKFVRDMKKQIYDEARNRRKSKKPRR